MQSTEFPFFISESQTLCPIFLSVLDPLPSSLHRSRSPHTVNPSRCCCCDCAHPAPASCTTPTRPHPLKKTTHPLSVPLLLSSPPATLLYESVSPEAAGAAADLGGYSPLYSLLSSGAHTSHYISQCTVLVCAANAPCRTGAELQLANLTTQDDAQSNFSQLLQQILKVSHADRTVSAAGINSAARHIHRRTAAA
ncbi:unnamed protein product [Pleuronectes platessa]|uniref:Uncharacterized protein n=1 Tax=Pleuronectes platessa TaxID=8262 RepID=A0A9N7VQH2_PLEPL|nr:unnamed protein product [Pleuronectes platessa]